MQLNLLETEDSIITVDIAKKPLYYGVDASSQFRKPELSCLRALPFMFILAFILFISITNVYSAQVTLEWNPNTEPDFAGHKIYSGTSSRNYDSVNDVGDLTSYTIQNLVEGQTYYIAVTAYNTFNTESDYSAEVVYTIPILDLTVPSNGSMDNDTQWTSSTGTWLVSSGANPYGANSFYSSESGATFEYIASGVNGEKEVSLWWTEWSSRCTSVQVDIYDGTTKIGTVNVNHQSNGGQWNSLGTYTFSGTARVVINSQGGCTTSADACKIAAAGTTTGSTLPTDGIMDNGSQWTSSTGTWQSSSGANPYGGGSLYSNTSGSYEYCATEVNGDKDVSLWWTYYSNRCTSVQVDIYDGNTNIGTVFVNQQENGGNWNSLGTYTFSGTAKVVINSQGGCTTSADACKIGGSAPPPTCPTLPTDGIMDNGSQWTSSTGTWLPSSGTGYYGTQSVYSNQAGATYTYCASVVNGVLYAVDIRWTLWSNRCTNVQIEAFDGNVSLGTAPANQMINGGQWNPFGTVSYSNDEARFVIRSQGGCTTSADAIRLLPLP